MPRAASYYLGAASKDSGLLARRPRISIGIVNNMPDAALQATERQFVTLLQAAATAYDIRIHLFTLPGIPRVGAALDRIQTRYMDYAAIRELHIDALIVSGAVPTSNYLASEPFWPDFIKLVDWARANTVSTIWSCLSAHAAVMHLDGVRRKSLPSKLSGVFTSFTFGQDALTAGVAPAYCTPHSRFNEVSESDLLKAGYSILGYSNEAGIDLFAKDTPSRFIFMQGHPEYDSDSLIREYRRDIGQFIRGERLDVPEFPVNYLSSSLSRQLKELATLATAQSDVDVLASGIDFNMGSLSVSGWASHAQQMFRSWIAEVARMKADKSARHHVAA